MKPILHKMDKTFIYSFSIAFLVLFSLAVNAKETEVAKPNQTERQPKNFLCKKEIIDFSDKTNDFKKLQARITYGKKQKTLSQSKAGIKTDQKVVK